MGGSRQRLGGPSGEDWHAVKNKRVTVQGPVKRPQMEYMSHRGAGPPPPPHTPLTPLLPP